MTELQIPETADDPQQQLHLSLSRYVRYEWRSILGHVWLYAYVAGVGAFTTYWVLLVWLLILAKQIHDWREMRLMLRWGDVCPAVVTDPANGYVAVYSDLTLVGEKPTRVVKVIRERLAIAGREFATGERVAAVVEYVGMRRVWYGLCAKDFSPIVVDCLVADPLLCRRLRETIDRQEWSALDSCLRQLGPQPRLGLHYMDPPDELVDALP